MAKSQPYEADNSDGWITIEITDYYKDFYNRDPSYVLGLGKITTTEMYPIIYCLTILTCIIFIYLNSKKWTEENGLYNSELIKLYKPPKDEYRLEHWNIEIKLTKRGYPIICPWCEIGGEYGPKDFQDRRNALRKLCF